MGCDATGCSSCLHSVAVSHSLGAAGDLPRGMDELCGDPWSRMNARACTMLLGAMPQELKGDMVGSATHAKGPGHAFQAVRVVPTRWIS